MVPAGDPTEDTVDSLGDAPRSPATSSSTAATPTGTTPSAAPRALAEARHRLRRRRHQRRRVGAHGGLLPDGRRRAPSTWPRRSPSSTRSAPEGGFVHTGPVGTGHFTKMVHNGIEYGLMQAYAEGYELLARSGLDIDATGALSAWRQGSVVRSWLLDLLRARASSSAPASTGWRRVAQDSGEGRWTVQEAVERGVAAPGDQRRAVRPLRQPGRRRRRHEGHRRAAQPVRRPRRAARGRPRRGRARRPAGRPGGHVSDTARRPVATRSCCSAPPATWPRRRSSRPSTRWPLPDERPRAR